MQEINQEAVPFSDFKTALHSLPSFITGLDLLSQHQTIADLRFLVEHEIDLYVEDDANTIKCRLQSHTTTRLRKCKAFIAHCDASERAAA